MPAIRKNIIAPEDHWKAFTRAAKAAKMSLSEWICQAASEKLPEKTASQLSKRQGVGRPADETSEIPEK